MILFLFPKNLNCWNLNRALVINTNYILQGTESFNAQSVDAQPRSQAFYPLRLKALGIMLHLCYVHAPGSNKIPIWFRFDRLLNSTMLLCWLETNS